MALPSQPSAGRLELFARVLNSSLALLALLQTHRASETGTEPDELAVSQAADRLRYSVIRPLLDAHGKLDPATRPPIQDVGSPDSAATGVDALHGEFLWSLAQLGTELRIGADAMPEMIEACAGLQGLALEWAPDGEYENRLQQLWQIQGGLPPSIQSERGGPYLVTNVGQLENWLGVTLPTPPQMALCRCGRSNLKPFCDGSHAQGFDDAKDPNRVPDQRQSYEGLRVTIFDNRGICQHSGLCTDSLSSVFRQGEEPFVRASGGRLDEIIQAVRACPSGALSFAIDGHEERQQVDWHMSRPRGIFVSKDGPYRVTGGIPLLNSEGEPEPRVDGASCEHYALCRCGHSQNKPFCSGMHWYVQFRDPVMSKEHRPTLFEWCGGFPALLRMTRIFYGKYVAEDSLLQTLFGAMSPDHPERVARWLAEVFGGPKQYSSLHGGYQRMLSQHIGRGITEEQRVRWVALLTRAANDAGMPNDPEFRSVFGSYVEWGSRLAVENSAPRAEPPPKMPMPFWDWETAAGPPWSRVSAIQPLADDVPPAAEAVADGEPVLFARHIKGRFRALDRRSMLFAFDLWSYDDVAKHADGILGRLRSGSMPCDGAWVAEDVAVFQRWVEGGKLQ